MGHIEIINPCEEIFEVFQRFNKLINDLNLNGKQYSNKEINVKFLLTLPEHLEHRVTAVRENRDMTKITLERLYGVLKTYELEQIQTKATYGRGKTVSTSTALVVKSPRDQTKKTVVLSSSNLEYADPAIGHTSEESDSVDFYTL